MTWLKLLLIIGTTLGCAAIIVLFIRYLKKAQQIRKYAGGVQKLISNSKNKVLKTNKGTADYQYAAVIQALKQQYRKQKLPTEIVLFSGTIDQVKDYFNHHDPASIISCDGIHLFINQQGMRFIVDFITSRDQLQDNGEIDIREETQAVQAIKTIKKLLKGLVKHKAIQTPKIKLYLSEKVISNALSDSLILSLKQLFKIRLIHHSLQLLVISDHSHKGGIILNKDDLITSYDQFSTFNELTITGSINQKRKFTEKLKGLKQKYLYANNHHDQDEQQDILQKISQFRQSLVAYFTHLSYDEASEINTLSKTYQNIANIAQTWHKQGNFIQQLVHSLLANTTAIRLLVQDDKKINSNLNAKKSVIYPVSLTVIMALSLAVSGFFIHNHLAIADSNISLNNQKTKEKLLISNDFLKNTSFKDIEKKYLTQVKAQKKALYSSFLYPNYGLYPSLDKDLSDKVMAKMINQVSLNSKDPLKSISYLVFLLSLQDNNLHIEINQQIDNWSAFTGLSTQALSLINKSIKQASPLPEVKLNPSILTDLLNLEESVFDQQKFIQNFAFINQKTVSLEQIQKLINSFYQNQLALRLIMPLKNIAVNSFSKLSPHNHKILTQLQYQLVQFKDNTSMVDQEYLNLSAFISTLVRSETIYDLGHLIQALEQANIQIEHFALSLPNASQEVVIKQLKQAYLNSLMNRLFQQDSQEYFSLLPQHYYEQYIAISTFNRQPLEMPIAYTKATITGSLKALQDRYKTLLNNYQSNNIESSLLSYLYDLQIHEYVENYIRHYDQLFLSAMPEKFTPKNIQLFLLDISAPQSPFANLLTYIQTNTNLDGSDLSNQVDKIKQHFSTLNVFSHSDEFQNYRSNFKNLSQMMLDKRFESYQKILEQLNNQDPDNISVKINKTLEKFELPMSVKARFMLPLKVVQDEVYKQLSLMVKEDWKLNLQADINSLSNLFPFNLTAPETISDEKLNQQLSPTGRLYISMKENLAPFIHQSINKQWNFNKDVPQSARKILQDNLTEFNQWSSWQRQLWDERGKPKALSIKIKGLKFDQISVGNEKISSSFIASQGKSIPALNTNENYTGVLVYPWAFSPSISVGWVSEDNQVYQQTFSGKWALFKMLLAAEKLSNSDQYSWDIPGINPIVSKAKIKFVLKNPLIYKKLSNYKPQKSNNHYQEENYHG